MQSNPRIDEIFPEQITREFFDTQRLKTLHRIRSNLNKEIEDIDEKIREMEGKGIKLD